MRGLITTLLVLICGAQDVYAAKKDFKGLFGSYRREKFTENEARSSELGLDLMLSTLIPFTSPANSSETSATSGTPLAFSTFFNVEVGVHYSFNYNWQVFALIGYYNYDTRKENGSITTQPLFHHFEMSAYPALAGVKYRFSTEDIVPYIGVGAGISHVKRRGSYDADSSGTLGAVDYSNPLTFSVMTGVEFYFMPRMGVKLEMSAMFFKLGALNYNPSPSSMDRVPALFFQPNVWTVRYASGIFFLF